MKRRITAILVLALALSIPAFAVFNERNFSKTLSILRSELQQEILKMDMMRERLERNNEIQHEQLIEMTRRSFARSIKPDRSIRPICFSFPALPPPRG